MANETEKHLIQEETCRPTTRYETEGNCAHLKLPSGLFSPPVLFQIMSTIYEFIIKVQQTHKEITHH